MLHQSDKTCSEHQWYSLTWWLLTKFYSPFFHFGMAARVSSGPIYTHICDSWTFPNLVIDLGCRFKFRRRPWLGPRLVLGHPFLFEGTVVGCRAISNIVLIVKMPQMLEWALWRVGADLRVKPYCLTAISTLFSIRTTGNVACQTGMQVTWSLEFPYVAPENSPQCDCSDQSRWIKDLSSIGCNDKQTLMTNSCQTESCHQQESVKLVAIVAVTNSFSCQGGVLYESVLLQKT